MHITSPGRRCKSAVVEAANRSSGRWNVAETCSDSGLDGVDPQDLAAARVDQLEPTAVGPQPVLLRTRYGHSSGADSQTPISAERLRSG